MSVLIASIDHFDLVFLKRPISLDESFKFQWILALGGLKKREQLVFGWGGDMTSVRKVRTPCANNFKLSRQVHKQSPDPVFMTHDRAHDMS